MVKVLDQPGGLCGHTIPKHMLAQLFKVLLLPSVVYEIVHYLSTVSFMIWMVYNSITYEVTAPQSFNIINSHSCDTMIILVYFDD